MLAEAERQTAAKDAARRRVESSRIGVMVLIEPGCSVWSKTRRYSDETFLGGVVIEITDGEHDPDTGFVARRFVTLNPYKAVRDWEETIDEGDVDRETVEVTNGNLTTRLIRRLAGEIAKSKGGLLPSKALRYCRYLHRLAALLA